MSQPSSRIRCAVVTGLGLGLLGLVPDPVVAQQQLGDEQLLGQKAAPVRAAQWLNAPAGTRQLSLGDGKVYLLVFTAYWCDGCVKWYEPLKQLAKVYDAKLNVVFVTKLYGGLGLWEKISGKNFVGKMAYDSAGTLAEELAYDKRIFLTRDQIPFPIAIAGDTTERAFHSPTTTLEGEGNESFYEVEQEPAARDPNNPDWPKLVLIDGQGVIRHVIAGRTLVDGSSDAFKKELVDALQEITRAP